MASPPDPGGVRKPDSTDKSRLVQHDVILPATGALKYLKIKLDMVSVDCKSSTEKVVSGFSSRSRWLTHNLVRELILLFTRGPAKLVAFGGMSNGLFDNCKENLLCRSILKSLFRKQIVPSN